VARVLPGGAGYCRVAPGGASSGGSTGGGTMVQDGPMDGEAQVARPAGPPVRAATPHQDDESTGVIFPLVAGRRSTSATGRAVLADAVRAVDPGLAAEALASPDWRSGYLESYRRMTELATIRPGAAASISADGLAAVHRRFVVGVDGVDVPLDQALSGALDPGRPPGLHTAMITGTAPRSERTLEVPRHGVRLSGGDLDRQLDAWGRAGAAEESFADAIRAVMAHPEWLDLRDLTVVVLGAAAELGPLGALVDWGAHVVAVDLPRFETWTRLIRRVRGSSGRMSVPTSRWLPSSASDDEIAAAAGADLLTHSPDVLAWLAGIDGPLTLGNYVYADGGRHVRASVAVDALTVALSQVRSDLSLAFLATPTDVFPVPQDAVDEAWRRYEGRDLLRRLGRLGRAGTGGRLLRCNYAELLTMPDGRRVGLNDSLVPQQGPNYALAKRIQRWRALHERANGRLVSLNVAPATRTRSVVRNRALAAAFAGSDRFGIEVFAPSTSNTLMAALLVHDLRNPAALANPATPLSHPVELFWQGACHGGLWRTAYDPRSVLGLAVVLGMIQRKA
jgi:hypothetical protein